MRQLVAVLVLTTLVGGCLSPEMGPASQQEPQQDPRDTIEGPAPRLQGSVSLEEALSERRSVRQYSDDPIGLEEASQLLWAAQGVTAEWGGRTAPSAGALYPLELYLVASRVDGLAPGVYRYSPDAHRLIVVWRGEVTRRMADAALDQRSVRDAAAVLVLTAVYGRTEERYGDRGVRYAHMEAGHAAQNVCLQAVSLGLGTVVVGAFEGDALRELLNAPREEEPLYLIPVGRPL